MYQECFKIVSRDCKKFSMVQELLRVSRLFQVCFKNISRDVQDYFNIDARVLEECFISF